MAGTHCLQLPKLCRYCTRFSWSFKLSIFMHWVSPSTTV